MQVAVLGAGALGSVFGGFLALSGHQVSLLGRPWHLDAINEHGLTIKGIWGEFLVENLDLNYSPKTLGSYYDLVLITVKGYQTEEMAALASRISAPEGLIISLQNGVANGEILLKKAGCERSAAGRVIFGAEIPAPGEVEVTVCADSVVLGPALAGSPEILREKIRAAAEMINEAGIPCRFGEDVNTLLWAKAMYNCALNPLGALLGVNYGCLAADTNTCAIMNEVINEVFAVATAKGIRFTWPSAAGFQEEFYSRLIPTTAAHRASMLQDIERGKRTEIDSLNGQIVRYGEELGVKTPVNKTLTALIKFREH